MLSKKLFMKIDALMPFVSTRQVLLFCGCLLLPESRFFWMPAGLQNACLGKCVRRYRGTSRWTRGSAPGRGVSCYGTHPKVGFQGPLKGTILECSDVFCMVFWHKNTSSLTTMFRNFLNGFMMKGLKNSGEAIWKHWLLSLWDFLFSKPVTRVR